MNTTVTAHETRRPFHETIIEVIRGASGPELECLANLIKTTKIPKNHKEIAEAWKGRIKVLGWGKENLGVLADLERQSQELLEGATARPEEAPTIVFV